VLVAAQHAVLQSRPVVLLPETSAPATERALPWKKAVSRNSAGPGRRAIGAAARPRQGIAGDGFRQKEGAIRPSLSPVVDFSKTCGRELALEWRGAGLGEVELSGVCGSRIGRSVLALPCQWPWAMPGWGRGIPRTALSRSLKPTCSVFRPRATRLRLCRFGPEQTRRRWGFGYGRRHNQTAVLTTPGRRPESFSAPRKKQPHAEQNLLLIGFQFALQATAST